MYKSLKNIGSIGFALVILVTGDVLALDIVSSTNMNFGSISKLGPTGYVIMSPAGIATPNGVQVVTPGVPGIINYKKANATYAITYSPTSLTLTNGTSSLVVDNFVSDPVTIANVGNDNANTVKPLNIGARATLNSNTINSGTYTGNVTITATRDNNNEIANTTMQVIVTIMPYLLVYEVTPMYFGKIMRPQNAGSVALNADGNFTTGVLPVMVSPQPGRFEIVGEKSNMVYITVDASTTLNSSSGSINITNIHPSSNSTILDATTGRATFSVGGTANLAAEQPSGTYTGSYTVMVSY